MSTFQVLCFMAGTSQETSNQWYLDSGCSRHMTGDIKLLEDVREENGPSVTFGDNNKGKTIGYGVIQKG